METLKTYQAEVNKTLYSVNTKSKSKYLDMYKLLYTKSLEIQKEKTVNIRHVIMNFYCDIIDITIETIRNYINVIYDKIKNDLESYYITYNNLVKSLKIISKVIGFVNKELMRLEENYDVTNILKFGLKTWCDNILVRFTDTINKKVVYLLNYENKPEDYEKETNIVSGVIDSIAFLINNEFIEPDFYQVKIIGYASNFLESKILNFSKIIDGTKPTFMETVDNFNRFYYKSISILSVDLLQELFDYKFDFYVIGTHKHHILDHLEAYLKEIDFEKFCEDYTLSNNIVCKLELCIRYLNDKAMIAKIIENFVNSHLSSIKDDDFSKLLDLNYLCYYLYYKITDLNILIGFKISKPLDTIFFKGEKDGKLLMKKLDKYIQETIYPGKNIPINYFQQVLTDYLKQFDDDIYIIYKNALIRRLYKNDFKTEKINAEIKIIDYFIGNLKHCDIYKLLKIKKDLLESVVFTLELNKINNMNNRVILTTHGIWGISPTKINLSCQRFNDKFVEFKSSVESFHKLKYENRRLEWNIELSCCTLKYKDISLICSFAQANELYKFNETDTIPYKECKVLITLEKYKLIKRDGENYILNPKFKSKSDVLDIKSRTCSTKKVKKRHDKEEAICKQDLLSAFVVRVLKQEKSLSKPCLLLKINEKYKFSETLVSKTIDKLVENCYIEFKEDDNTYVYVV